MPPWNWSNVEVMFTWLNIYSENLEIYSENLEKLTVNIGPGDGEIKTNPYAFKQISWHRLNLMALTSNKKAIATLASYNIVYLMSTAYIHSAKIWINRLMHKPWGATHLRNASWVKKTSLIIKDLTIIKIRF